MFQMSRWKSNVALNRMAHFLTIFLTLNQMKSITESYLLPATRKNTRVQVDGPVPTIEQIPVPPSMYNTS